MAARKLDKAQWEGFFDRMTKVLAGERAEIEVASLELGDQIAAEWLPLLGISYDPKGDDVVVALDGVNHIIHAPREIWIDFGPVGLASLEIVDAAGARQIVQLRDPVMLPAPSSAGG
jgi:hypothetical protein